MASVPDPLRDALEATVTGARIAELQAKPVHGVFDAAHLKEINRRIFQDLPGLGFNEVTPGEFRPAAPEGKDWLKGRGLSTASGTFFVAYSAMDQAARGRLDAALSDVSPARLSELKTPAFVQALARLYVEIDYLHPFLDGNSRTLRAFTRQLAGEAGFVVEWERFGVNAAGRDLLYIARDLSVNALAKPNIRSEFTLRSVLQAQAQLQGNRDLADLLRDVVRPTRAVAFERLEPLQALQVHPELREAFETMTQAGNYFESKSRVSSVNQGERARQSR